MKETFQNLGIALLYALLIVVFTVTIVRHSGMDKYEPRFVANDYEKCVSVAEDAPAYLQKLKVYPRILRYMNGEKSSLSEKEIQALKIMTAQGIIGIGFANCKWEGNLL